MYIFSACLALLASLPATFQQATGAESPTPRPCAFLGPDFPAPQRLASSPLLGEAQQAFEELVGNSQFAGSNSTSWSIALFSSASNETLFETHYTAQNVRDSPVGVEEVDRDSSYRIASITKSFVVWTLLASVGDRYYNHPVTDFVPELRSAASALNVTMSDSIEHVRWEDITVLELASQTAGLTRNVGNGEISSNPSVPLDGFPELDPSELPECGAPDHPPCNRQQILSALSRSRPVFPTSHSPNYSNDAFSVLTYVIESITGKDFETVLREQILDPLGMTGSGLSPPVNASFAVIPGPNIEETAWNLELGDSAGAGGMYASTRDMIAAGQSILSSSLLSAAQTRRWLRPISNTASMRSFVGAPWEIQRVESPNGRVTDYYAKAGNLAAYNSRLILSPDHGIGIIVLTATNGESFSFDSAPDIFLSESMVNSFMPRIEEAARQEASDNFAGNYTDATTNSSVSLSVDDSFGLVVTELRSRGAYPFDALADTFQLDALSTRLYPTTLNTINPRTNAQGTYASRIGFRSTFLPRLPEANPFAEGCLSWILATTFKHGEIPLDDFDFNMREDGSAASLSIPALRLNLTRDP